MIKKAGPAAASDRRFEHGIHAFVFLSIIFAETLKLLIETLTSLFRDKPIPLGDLVHRPEGLLLLFAVTILTVQYWWSVFKSAGFYGQKLGFFTLGVLEAGTFYAIAFFFHDFYLHWQDAAKYNFQVKREFFLLIALIFMFLIIDPVKCDHLKLSDEGSQKELGHRELLRGVGILLCYFGLCGVYPWLASILFLMLVVIYTFLYGSGDGYEPAPH